MLGFPAVTVTPATASQEKTLTIPVTMDTYKVNIRIAKGIPSADPINADTSKELNKDVFLVAADTDQNPMVISMRRADNPLLPVTAATVQVIVTLSEEAKEFKKGNFSISDNATIADPVALDPVGEDPNRYRVLSERIGRSRAEDVPIMRGLYNEDRDGNNAIEVDAGGDDLPAGIHAAILADITSDSPSDAAMDLDDALKAYNRAVESYNAVVGDSTPAVTAIADPLTVAELPVAQTGAYLRMVHRPFHTFSVGGDDNDDITYPATGVAPSPARAALLPAAGDADAIEEAIAAVDILPLNRHAEPVRPAVGDGPDALALYTVLQEVYDLFIAEDRLHYAYRMAVAAEMQADEDALEEYFAVELGELVPNATGRDDMLHPYVVTITPKYPAGKADIVLKIGAWEDTNIPISNKYNPPLTDEGYTEGVDKITIKVGKEILTALESGTPLYLPHGEGAMIPASGFYLLTKNKDGSGIAYSHEKDDENKAHKQTPEQLKFNVRAEGIPNLESNLAKGATIDLVAYDGTAATAAYISEVMWGSDASQADSTNSQWIEIANTTTSAIAVGEKKWALWTYQPHETPPSCLYRRYTD